MAGPLLVAVEDDRDRLGLVLQELVSGMGGIFGFGRDGARPVRAGPRAASGRTGLLRPDVWGRFKGVVPSHATQGW
jgi:hypothetical protein